MQVEMRKMEKVIPYARNPRKNQEAVDAMTAFIREFGFRQPIVVDGEGVIVCGHTRYLAARRLDMKAVPVHVARELTPTQVKAYRVADNRLAQIASWDEELLSLELIDLKEAGLDMQLLAFSEAEFEKFLGADFFGTGGVTDPDVIPEPPDEPVTQPGDLWLLGEHRLLCGDAGSAEDVDRLLDGAKIQLVNTDPPYNVKVEPRSSTAIAAGQSNRWVAEIHGDKAKKKMHHQGFDVARGVTDPKKARKKMRPKDRPLINDFVSDEEFAALLRAWFGQMARVLEPGRGFYIWGGYANITNYPPALKECELYFSQTVIWVKEHPVLTRKDFMGNHEWCFYGWREGAAHYFTPEIKNATDVWSVKKVNPQSMIHLTEKPVELAVRAMTYSSKPGENVLDLFGGSGSTLIACEQAGRHAFLMEMDALYCDVIVRRWEEFTGHKGEGRRVTDAVQG